MNTVQRIAKNTVVLYAARIASSLFSLLLTVCITRMLGDSTFGKYSFAIVFAGLFSILTNLGMNELLIREVAKNKIKANKYLGNILVIRLILIAIVFALIVIVINLMNYPADTMVAVYLFGISTLLASLSAIFRVTFRAFEQMGWEAVSTIIERAATFLLSLLVLLSGLSLIGLAYASLIGSIINLFFTVLICVKRFVKPKIEIDLHFWKEMVKTAIPFSLSNVFVMLYVRIDTIMLSVMKGDSAVGLYSAAYNLVLAFEPIVFAFMSSVFPVMSRMFISSEDSLKVVYEKSCKYLLIIGLPICMGGMILSNRIILFLFGENFVGSIIALQILIWNCLLLCLYKPMLYLLCSINKQNQMALIGGMGALINIGLNLILIPRFSYVGAGITTIITEFLITAASWYAISKYLYRLSIHKIIIKPLIASITMSVIVYWLSQNILTNLPLLIISGAILYIFFLHLIGGFSEEDKRLFKQVIRIRRNQETS